jgi:hypothetical protein
MKERVVVHITDESVGVEGLPKGVVVEIRDYREASVDREHASAEYSYVERRAYIPTVFDGGLP